MWWNRCCHTDSYTLRTISQNIWKSSGKKYGLLFGIIISKLTSPISPVKPLGGYEIAANIAQDGVSWTLSTTSGPLLLKGQGEFSNTGSNKGMHFSGEANASPESQESLIGLLSLLGKREGDTYRLKF